MDVNKRFYRENAEPLARTYNKLPFERVHQSWSAYWPNSDCSDSYVLDVGAGSGRDSHWMALRGAQVIAVEPAYELAEIGKELTAGLPVTWIDDCLPGLLKTTELGMRFDLILVSAVWMHLAYSHREKAFRKLSNLLKPGGRLVITLRHGDFSDGRVAYPTQSSELEKFARRYGLAVSMLTQADSDAMGRGDVSWQSVVFTLPDDGKGSLSTIRHVIVNESKSATYKLALLRTLLRIADAHPGSVLDRTDGKVIIPLGLVALYWTRQFMRLVNQGGLHQSANSNAGLGFVKKGWLTLKQMGLMPDDLSIGALLSPEESRALISTFQDVLATIKSGPVTYTYRGDKSNPLFAMERKRVNIKGQTVLDQHFFASFGHFTLEEELWDCLRLYGSWIEPMLIQQWVAEMKRYRGNIAREESGEISLEHYYIYLQWLDPKHDTSAIRQRMIALYQNGFDLTSVWTGTKLKPETSQIDHCLPFAHWPNNDKWNLLPTTSKENRAKSDRLPSAQRLNDSRQRIIHWWQSAYDQTASQERFFIQAQMALPGLPAGCQDFEAVYEAMGLQIAGLKSRLLLPNW
ncbi:methyltransferase domain-containing protein [Ferrimonas gelatinilytica]|uniref:Class I SAM-dependent methyltransferase n=1 Tax=Ferrimonas gelatinilytica TaxID=1255257 RepID=A0ABP9S0R4_9GAMM